MSYKKTQFAGIYYRESQKKGKVLPSGAPDKCYYISFIDPHSGRQIFRKAGWASQGWDPKKALRFRAKLMEDARAGEYGPAKVPKFSEFFENDYLPFAKQNKKSWKDDENYYKNWIKPYLGDKKMTQISPILLERLKRGMRKAGKRPASVAHVLKIINRIFNLAEKWGKYSGGNPVKKVDFPRFDNKRRRFLSPEECRELLETLKPLNIQVYWTCCFSLYAGLRLGEIFGLDWSDIDLQNELLLIKDPKNKQSRYVPISEPLKGIIFEMMDRTENLEGPVFINKKGERMKWLPPIFGKVVKRLEFNNGITDPRDRVCFHTLRHTFASHAVMQGVPLVTVGEILGHKSLQMTKRYSHLVPEALKQGTDAVAEALKQEKTHLRIVKLP